MPNYCMNTISIGASKEILEQLAAVNFSFEKLIPVPDELQEFNKILAKRELTKEEREYILAKYGVKDSHYWRIKNWGTKWDIKPDSIEVYESNGEYSMSFIFDSAWAPPVQAIKTLWEHYNKQLDIRMEYFEYGMKFLGVVRATNKTFVDDYREFETLDELEVAAKEIVNNTAIEELGYLREMELEKEQFEMKTKIIHKVIR